MPSPYLMLPCRSPEEVAEARLIRRHQEARPFDLCDTCNGSGIRESSRGYHFDYECDHCDGEGGTDVRFEDWIERLPADDADVVILYGSHMGVLLSNVAGGIERKADLASDPILSEMLRASAAGIRKAVHVAHADGTVTDAPIVGEGK